MALVLSCSEIVIADCKDDPDNKSFVESYFKILMRMVMKILTVLVMYVSDGMDLEFGGLVINLEKCIRV